MRPDEVIGKQFFINDTTGLTVSGIVQDLVANTNFTFTTFVSKPTLETTSLRPADYAEWDNTNGASQLYVKLSAGRQPAQAEKDIIALYNRHHKKEAGDNSKIWFHLQPLSDIHFGANYNAYDIPVVNKSVLYSLLAVAAFLLILGCINFINLTTAQSSQRAKEIGIRKTMGGTRKQLIVQFLSETFLLTVLATVVSLALTPLLLKAFAGFIPEGLHFNLAAQPGIAVFLFGLVLVVTALSGFYPALILSSYKPVLVLKNQVFSHSGKTRKAWLRKSLTVSQFAIAQFFIMATLFVSSQISYSLTKDMGFKKDAIVYFRTNFYDTSQSHRTLLRDRLQAIPEIAMVSLSSNPPSSGSTWSGTMKYKDGKKEIETDVQQKYADTNYIQLYHIKLLAGTNLAASDTVNQFLINETYAHILGFQHPEQAIGKNIAWSDKQIPITGVVADFNQKSLHEPIKPLVIGSWGSTEQMVNLALRPQNNAGTTWKTALAKAEKVYKQIYPADDFDYSFFDEDIAKYYTQEQNISSLLKWATVLAVFISCLGLLGLVMYTTSQRTKEIGVRKVLGATVAQIITLVSIDFLLLVLVAFVIATPLAWLGINKWLENFAYRTAINWWLFVLSGICMLVLALLTVSIQTIKAAIANPVKSLRTE